MLRSTIPAATTFALLGAVVAAPAATAAEPGAATRSVQQKVSHVDIDGDGRGDLTTLTLVNKRGDRATFRLTVKTARGPVASTLVQTESYGPIDFSCVWPITSGFDGVRGNEIAINPFECVGDGQSYRVITWRNGKLVTLAAPGGGLWSVNAVSDIYGYTFSMSGSTRYVTRHFVRPSASHRTYSGTNTVYRWAPKGWVKVKTTKVGPISQNAAWKMNDFRGLILR